MLTGLTLPFEYTAVSVAGFPLTPNRAVVALLLVFVGLQWAVERRRAHPDSKRVWVFFFAGVLVISAVQTIVSYSEIRGVLEILTTYYSLILFYLILGYTLVSRQDLDLLLVSLVIGLVFATVTGMLGFGFVYEGMYGERVGGEGGNPNLLAFNLLVGMAVAGSLFFTTQRRWAKPLYVVAVFVMGLGILATLSRTAFLTLPCMAILWAVRFRRADLLKYALPALVLPVVAIFFVPERVVERIQDLVYAESVDDLDKSAQSRFHMLPDVARAFAGNPATGVGLGGWRAWSWAHGSSGLVIHNGYLQVLAEQGLLGFFPFIMVFVLTWRQLGIAWKLARRFRHKRDAELGVLEIRAVLLQVAFAGALIVSLAQPTNRHKVLWLLFTLSTVVVALVRNRLQEIAPQEQAERLAWSPSFVTSYDPVSLPFDRPSR